MTCSLALSIRQRSSHGNVQGDISPECAAGFSAQRVSIIVPHSPGNDPLRPVELVVGLSRSS
jgi:hypothetical protein